MSRCMFPSAWWYSWLMGSLVARSWFLKTNHCCWVFETLFSALWAPQAECHLVPLYPREERHHYRWYPQNTAKNTKREKAELPKLGNSHWNNINGRIVLQVRGQIFDYRVNCTFNVKCVTKWSLKGEEQTLNVMSGNTGPIYIFITVSIKA